MGEDRAGQVERLAAAIIAAINDPKLRMYFPTSGILMEVQAKMVAAGLIERGVTVGQMVPLEPETHEHDMAEGPCKCGAWHNVPPPPKVTEAMVHAATNAILARNDHHGACCLGESEICTDCVEAALRAASSGEAGVES